MGEVDGPFVAVVSSTSLGHKGEFATAYPVKLDNPVTFSLGVWESDRQPEGGEVVVLEKIFAKVGGWRASKARPYVPADDKSPELFRQKQALQIKSKQHKVISGAVPEAQITKAPKAQGEKMKNAISILSILIVLAVAGTAYPQTTNSLSFKERVGNIRVGDVQWQPGQFLNVPFITWGGDMASFYANGGLKTQKGSGSIFDKQGLTLNFINGDNFGQQVKDYLEGKTPFVRGTFRMMGMASEVLGSDPRTKPVIFMQMTWSAGDHCVVKPGIKTVADLKGKKIALQKYGPHVGMLDDILESANLTWKDIQVVWAEDLTGSDKAPSAIFKKNDDVAACFVITPDMIGLTGGLHNIGGAEGTFKGAKVLVSTAELSYSIADVYACRKDFYDKHRDVVEKFTAGYLKACEEVLALKKKYSAGGSPEYLALCKMGNQIFNLNFKPESEDGSLGMLLDCTFVGHPGNVAFFTNEKNLHGFTIFQDKALKLATSQGYASVKQGFTPSPLDWNSKAFVGLATTEVKKGEKYKAEALIGEIEKLSSGGALDDKTIWVFDVNFQANQDKFTAVEYGVQFDRVVKELGKYGNAVIAIRGHADPSKTLLETVQAGMNKGILKRAGTPGNYTYSLEGKPLDLSSTARLIELIEKGSFDGEADHNPREVMQSALNLSRKRAEAVREAILAYAKEKGVILDPSQIQPVGVGIREPFIAKPSSMQEAEKNMRVEFRLLRVQAEALKQSDFDF